MPLIGRLSLCFCCWALALALVTATRVKAEEAAIQDGVLPASHVADGATSADEKDRRFALCRELMRRRGGDPAAVAQLVQLAREFEPVRAALLFDELAEAHRRAGKLDLAADVRRTLVEQFPQEPAARDALLWLVRLYSSSEVAASRRQTTPGSAPAGLTPTAAKTEKSLDEPLLTYALHLAAAATTSGPEEDPRPASPALVFQRAVATRRLGNRPAGQAILSPLNHTRAGDPWGDCARTEEWLDEGRKGTPPRPTATCLRTSKAPELDGTLDEGCWQGEAIVLRGEQEAAKPQAADEAHAEVRLARDDEYLYVAVSCPKANGVRYDRDARPRAHDADLAGRDVVRLRLDLDRDYATWFELAVDSRGFSTDGAWDDAAWNPRWYIAAGETVAATGPRWTIEAAIPLTELGVGAFEAGTVWAAAIERSAPGSAVETWVGKSADQATPASFGLILLE